MRCSRAGAVVLLLLHACAFAVTFAQRSGEHVEKAAAAASVTEPVMQLPLSGSVPFDQPVDIASFQIQSSPRIGVASTPPLPMHPRFEALPVRTLEGILADARANQRKRRERERRSTAGTFGSAADVATDAVLSSPLGSPSADPTLLDVDALPHVPPSYDPRSSPQMNASFCDSVSSVRDQGDCASDWAAAVAAAMSDRICIQSGAQQQPILSIQDILSCCGWVSSPRTQRALV